MLLDHTVLNYIQNTNKVIVGNTYATLHTLQWKSTLIREVGEQDSENFFDGLRERIYKITMLASYLDKHF